MEWCRWNYWFCDYLYVGGVPSPGEPISQNSPEMNELAQGLSNAHLNIPNGHLLTKLQPVKVGGFHQKSNNPAFLTTGLSTQSSECVQSEILLFDEILPALPHVTSSRNSRLESLDARWKAPGLIRSFLESFVKSDHRGRYPTSTKSCTRNSICTSHYSTL